MDLKNILVRNTITGESKKFESLNDFKAFFTDFDAILTNYHRFNKNADENTFLKAFDFNWNSWRTNNWAILSCSIQKKTKKQAGNGLAEPYFSETLQKWVWQYYDNNHVRQTLTQRKKETKTEFFARVTKTKSQLNDGTYIGKSKDILYDIIKKHIEQKLSNKILTDISYKRNLETLAQLEKTCVFIHSPIQSVIIEQIEDAKEIMSKKYSQSCIDKQWGLLRKGFSISFSRKKINFNIMQDPELLKPISDKPIKNVQALTISEQEKFEQLLDNELKDHKYRNVVKLQLETAMRIGEVLARSIDNYNYKDKTLLIDNTLTKNANDKIILGKHTKTYDRKTGIDLGKRILFLSESAYKILDIECSKKITNIHKLIFWDYEKNDFYTGSEINSWLDRINKKYHITSQKLSTHVLRHTRITRWIEANIAMAVIQYWAGHVEGSTITNNTYFDLQEDYIKQEKAKYDEYCQKSINQNSLLH